MKKFKKKVRKLESHVRDRALGYAWMEVRRGREDKEASARRKEETDMCETETTGMQGRVRKHRVRGIRKNAKRVIVRHRRKSQERRI